MRSLKRETVGCIFFVVDVIWMMEVRNPSRKREELLADAAREQEYQSLLIRNMIVADKPDPIENRNRNDNSDSAENRKTFKEALLGK